MPIGPYGPLGIPFKGPMGDGGPPSPLMNMSQLMSVLYGPPSSSTLTQQSPKCECDESPGSCTEPVTVPCFTRNDVVAYAEGDKVKMAHLVRPFAGALTMNQDVMGGSLLQAETIGDDEVIDLDTSELILVERGLRFGDIVVAKENSIMEKANDKMGMGCMPAPGKGEQFVQKIRGTPGQVVGRKMTADVRIVGTNLIARNIPTNLKTKHVAEVTYEWNKKSVMDGHSNFPSASYGRETNFYLYSGWIGEILSEGNMVEMEANGHKLSMVLGHGREAFGYVRLDGCDNRKKALMEGDAIRIRIQDALVAKWEGGIPEEMKKKRRGAHRKTDGVECIVKKVTLHNVIFSWLRPNALDGPTIAKMMREPPHDEVSVADLRSSGRYLDRRRWLHTGDRIRLRREDCCDVVTEEMYEAIIHNQYAEELSLEKVPVPSPDVPFVPEEFIGEILLTRTSVDIQWSNGLLSSLPSIDLCPANDLVELFPRHHGHAPTRQPLFPGMTVKRKQDEKKQHYRTVQLTLHDGAYGVVLSADEKEQIATVQWLTLKKGKVTIEEGKHEECSYFDLDDGTFQQIHGGMLRCGDLCMLRKNNQTEAIREIFRLGRLQPNGQFRCHFWDGRVELLWPVEVQQMMSGYEMVLQGPNGELMETTAMVPSGPGDGGIDPMESMNTTTLNFNELQGEGEEMGVEEGMMHADADDYDPNLMPEEREDLLMRDMALLSGVVRKLATTNSGLQNMASNFYDYWYNKADELQKTFFHLSDCVLRVLEFGIAPNNDLSQSSVVKLIIDVESNQISTGKFVRDDVLERLNTLSIYWETDAKATELAISAAMKSPLKEDGQNREEEKGREVSRNPLHGARDYFSVIDMGRKEEKQLLEELMSVVRGDKSGSPDSAASSGDPPSSSLSDDLCPSVSSFSLDPSQSTFTGEVGKEAVEEEEEEDTVPQCLQLVPSCFSDHHFVSGPSSTLSPSFLKAVKKEMTVLNELPPGIFVSMYQDRMDLLSAIIIGPSDTPFETTPFHFELKLPHDYPKSPPLVFFSAFSTDAINPNLYQDGKVCLSLLGTWSGTACERWNPQQSNILQILVSIQGLILNSDPYWNEPGYELRKEEKEEKSAALRYNERVVLGSLQYMEGIVKKPPTVFKNLVRGHVKREIESHESKVNGWMSGSAPFPLLECSKGFQMVVHRTIKNIKEETKKQKN